MNYQYTKNDYMSKKVDHNTFYGQYVTDSIKRIVESYIGINNILKSNDLFFNDIPLYKWDNLHGDIQSYLPGIDNSLAFSVCVAKAAATKIKETQKMKTFIKAKFLGPNITKGPRIIIVDISSGKKHYQNFNYIYSSLVHQIQMESSKEEYIYLFEDKGWTYFQQK